PSDPPLIEVGRAAAGAALVAVLAWSVARAKDRVDHRGGSASLVDADELRTRLDLLAEQAIVGGTALSVVLVAPGAADADLHRLGSAVAARSRGDDVVAALRDVLAVALPGAWAADATVYAARVVTTLAGVAEVSSVGVATVRDAADSADVLLRRARRALRDAGEHGPGLIGVEGGEGVALHRAEDVAAVPGAGGRLD
ncbi:MAG TPA: hypothetical protein PKB06_13130, partial [Actinotalea sp.]|nr:hypothetical protein [Actinotalea sp.]